MKDHEHRADDEKHPGQHPPQGGHPVNPESAVPPLTATGAGHAGDPAIHGAQGDAGRHQPLEPSPPPPPVVVNVQATQPDSKWMTGLTAIIAFATVVNVVVFWLESEDTSKKIETLSTKAGGIVDALKTALSDNQTALKDAMGQNRAAVEASTKQSGEALKASIDASRTDQRAWVSPGFVGLPRFVDGNNPVYWKAGEAVPQMEVQIFNSGKTPAIGVTYRVQVGAFTPKQLFDPVYVDDVPQERSKIVLAPNAPAFILSTIAPRRFISEAEVDALKRRSLILRFYGRIDYFDIFKYPHHTTFCMYLVPSLGQWSGCQEYNEQT